MDAYSSSSSLMRYMAEKFETSTSFNFTFNQFSENLNLSIAPTYESNQYIFGKNDFFSEFYHASYK